jgi:uncharacterized protein (UPF0262 family)
MAPDNPQTPAPTPSPAPTGRLIRIHLEGEALTRLSALQEADRTQAVTDLQSDNHFALAGRPGVETILHLSIHEGRLVFDVRDAADLPISAQVLALGPFRALIKDYQMLLDSYASAVSEGREARIQAIDMGRRGLHNEGADLLVERLRGKIDLDFETARRLFTLLCALHRRVA